MHLLNVCVLSVVLLLGFPCITSEIVDRFSKCSNFFFNKMPPRIPGILEDSSSQEYQCKTICQKYENRYRFATFYNTTNRTPLFSAYTYTGMKSYKKPQSLRMIERQLESSGKEMHVPFNKQARPEDYLQNCQNLTVSHLFPSSHATDRDTAKSTFTLTNAVPQKESFKNGSWKRMINNTKHIMENYCRNEKKNKEVLAYVLTGAVPGNSQLNKRVNIPSYMWMAFCCYNSTSRSWVSQAYWAPNIGKGHDENRDMTEKNLTKLQEHFNDKWVNNVELFYNNCNKTKIF